MNIFSLPELNTQTVTDAIAGAAGALLGRGVMAVHGPSMMYDFLVWWNGGGVLAQASAYMACGSASPAMLAAGAIAGGLAAIAAKRIIVAAATGIVSIIKRIAEAILTDNRSSREVCDVRELEVVGEGSGEDHSLAFDSHQLSWP